MTDEVARELQSKGTECFQEIVRHFGKDILDKNGELDRPNLAQIVFSDPEKLKTLNEIVHPAVKAKIKELISYEEEKQTALFIVESALLFDDHYDNFCDEVWFIFAREEVRKKRLKLGRGYSEEKTQAIIDSQLSRDEFLNRCDRAIDNSRSFEETCAQIDSILDKL